MSIRRELIENWDQIIKAATFEAFFKANPEIRAANGDISRDISLMRGTTEYAQNFVQVEDQLPASLKIALVDENGNQLSRQDLIDGKPCPAIDLMDAEVKRLGFIGNALKFRINGDSAVVFNIPGTAEVAKISLATTCHTLATDPIHEAHFETPKGHVKLAFVPRGKEHQFAIDSGFRVSPKSWGERVYRDPVVAQLRDDIQSDAHEITDAHPGNFIDLAKFSRGWLGGLKVAETATVVGDKTALRKTDGTPSTDSEFLARKNKVEDIKTSRGCGQGEAWLRKHTVKESNRFTVTGQDDYAQVWAAAR